MSSIIPKEQSAGFKRWQFDAFDAPPAEAASSPPPEETTVPPAPPDVAPEAQIADSIDSFPLPTAEDIERLHEQARAEGYQAGLEEGRAAAAEEARQQQETEIAKIRQLTANLHQALDHLDQEIADQLLDLSLEVAHQVLRSALEIRREILLPIIREAIDNLPLHHGGVALHLNPTDLEQLQAPLSEMASQQNLHLVPDHSIEPGGCSIKAGHSEVDARLETRWQRVLEAIGIESDKWMTH